MSAYGTRTLKLIIKKLNIDDPLSYCCHLVGNDSSETTEEFPFTLNSDTSQDTSKDISQISEDENQWTLHVSTTSEEGSNAQEG